MSTLRRSVRSRLATLLISISIMTATFGLAVVPVAFAGTSCGVWASSVWTDGVYNGGTSYMNCWGGPQITSWVKGELVEVFGFWNTTQASCQTWANTFYQIDCSTNFYCNGHGTDDWFERAKGRDTGGGESVWIEGSRTSITC